MTAIDLRVVQEALLELDPTLAGSEEDEFYKTALVLLSPLVCGPDTTRLAKFTKLPPEFVAKIHRRMITAELWTELDLCCDHWFGSDNASGFAFWADVLVGLGLAVRKWFEADGEYRYRVQAPAADHGSNVD